MGNMFKRYLAFVLAVVMTIGVLPSISTARALESPQHKYHDVDGHWGSDAISRWSDYGVISGGADGAFRPDAPITRGEMAKIIATLLHLTAEGENIFDDLAADAWYTPYILRCYAAGIMVGDGAGHVRPEDPIARQEACKMLAVAFGIDPAQDTGKDTFADGDAIHDWALPYVLALRNAGYIQGVGGGFFAPLDAINRASAVAILDNAVAAYITEPGTYSGAYNGNVIVTCDGVVFENSTIGGNLIVTGEHTEGESGVTVKDSTIQGNLLTNGGAVDLQDSTVDGTITAPEGSVTDSTDPADTPKTPETQGEEKVSDWIPGSPDPDPGPNPSVSITSISDVDDLEVGQNVQITVTVAPSAAVVTAVSDTTSVATVAVAGKTLTVTGVAQGTANITVTATLSGYQTQSVSFAVAVEEAAQDGFLLFDGTSVPDIYVSAGDHAQVLRVVGDLQADIERVTEMVPVITNNAVELGELAIIVGSVGDSAMIQSLRAAGLLDEADGLDGKWESYLLKIVDNPLPGVDRALVIAGSDKRGTAYGVYDLSEQIGVSPWYYWGDIAPKVQSRIVIDQPLKIQGEPSVKYRGIFINDEQNFAYWAAKTEPKVLKEGSNIGPDTYQKVFELLLRLKANYLWPAMHSEPRLGPDANSTKQLGAIDHFNKYPENRELAGAYGILIGTSHCEPMMRNGTAEWGEFLQANGYLSGQNFAQLIGTGSNDKVDGWMYNYNKNNSTKDPIPRYDYSENVSYKLAGRDATQKQFIDAYWRQGVEFFKNYETSYTIGMRGLHDEGFRTEDASSDAAKLTVLQAVIDSQIQMLEDNDVHPESIPIFIPYKEVLTLYEAGLELPEETIIVWAEDNHGYIRRFPTQEELDKYAGSGVYYHLNYEGSSSYSWLNSVSPGLMLSELRKAYESGAGTLWVINAGDIKPSEISLELFAEMAWNIDRWDETNLNGTEDEASYYELLAEKWFPDTDSAEVGALIQGYYHLVSILKPDHGNNGNRLGFSLVNNGDEFMQRVAELQDMAERSLEIYDELHAFDVAQADAFYQHVAYPLVGTYFNNAKYYHAQKSTLYKKQGRMVEANMHADLVTWAHDQENLATEYYNTGISDGKWNFIMQPHNSNNLRADRSPKPSASTVANLPYVSQMGVVTEGESAEQQNSALSFSVYGKGYHYVDVFNKGVKSFAYTVTSDAAWVTVSETSGTVYDSVRLFVTIDWANLPAGDQTATLTITGTGALPKTITITVNNPAGDIAPANGYVEANGYVAMEAEHYTSASMDGVAGFFVFEGLGRTGAAVSAGPMGTATYDGNLENAPYLSYEVYFQSSGTFPTTVYRIPTLETSGQQFAIGVDNGTPTLLKGQNIAESDSWGTNIVNGIQKMDTTITVPTPGLHTIKLYMVDAGVGVDRIVINTGGAADSNHGPFESYHSVYNTEAAEMPKLLSMDPAYLDAYLVTVEALIDEMQDNDLIAMLEAELAAVRTMLEAPGDDTVRRAYGRMVCAVESVNAMEDIDTLIAAAIALGAKILENGGASGIEVYRPELITAFESVYPGLKSALEVPALSLAEKLTAYEALLTAIYTVEAGRLLRVTVSSSEADKSPHDVVDGNLETRWAANGSSVPQWVELDFGQTYAFDQISILWFHPGSGTRTYQYTVQVSLDGVNYLDAVDRSANNVQREVIDNMNGALGRYVRVYITGRSGGSVSLHEIAVTGTKVPMATEQELDALRDALAAVVVPDITTTTADSYAAYMAAVAYGEGLLLLQETPSEAVAYALTQLDITRAALKTRTIYAYHIFDDAANFAALAGQGWSAQTDVGTVGLADDGAGNKYLHVVETSKASGAVGAVLDLGEQLAGRVYIEATVKANVAAVFCAPFLYSTSTFTSANTLAGVQMRPDGKFDSSYKFNSSDRTTVGNYTVGEWNTICMVVDNTQNTYEVYYNGVRVDNGSFVMRQQKPLQFVRFYTDDTTNAQLINVYIDNVQIYREGTLVNPPPLGEVEQARVDLAELMDDAGDYDEPTEYTVDSYAALVTAVANGQTELDKPENENTLGDLDACIAELEAAIDGLTERNYIINDEFDTLTTIDELEGWELVQTNGAVSLEVDGENKYLKIAQSQKSDSNVEAIRHFASTQGKIYVEAKVRSDTPENPFFVPFFFPSYSSDVGASNTNLGGVALRDGTPNGSATTGNISTSLANTGTSWTRAAGFAAGEWYVITLVADTATSKVQVYVDGVLVSGNLVFRGTPLNTSLGALRYYINDTTAGRRNGVGYLDNVRVYTAAAD